MENNLSKITTEIAETKSISSLNSGVSETEAANAQSVTLNTVKASHALVSLNTPTLSHGKKAAARKATNSNINNNKKLKQYNDNLERHQKQHQLSHEIEFASKDSFLEKFSLMNTTQLSADNLSQKNISELMDQITKERTPMALRRNKRLNASLRSITAKRSSPVTITEETNSRIISVEERKNLVEPAEFNVLIEEENTNMHKDDLATTSYSLTNKSENLGDKNSFTITKPTKRSSGAQLKQNSKQNSTCNSSITSSTSSLNDAKPRSLFKTFVSRSLIKLNYFVLSPDDNAMFAWLVLLNACVLYNIWLIIARQSFEKLQQQYHELWIVLDYFVDGIYLLDVFIQFRTGYLEQGLLVYNSKKLAKNYVKSRSFLLDVFSLLPLELIQYKLDYELPILRFTRFFKCYRTIDFYYMTESRTLYPNVWRVANLTHILFLLGHWFAGFYFMISKAEGFKGEFCVVI